MFLCPRGRHQEMELLGHMAALVLLFWEIAILTLKKIYKACKDGGGGGGERNRSI